MYCRKCGKEIPENALFCTYCGTETGNGREPEINIEELYQTEPEYEYRRKAAKTNHWMFWLPAIIFIPSIILILALNINATPVTTSNNQNYVGVTAMPYRPIEDVTAVKEIQNSYMPEYSSKITIGEVFDTFFEDLQWFYQSKNDTDYITVQGLAEGQQKGAPITVELLFEVKNDEFQITSWKINGAGQDLAKLPDVLKEIYRKGA